MATFRFSFIIHDSVLDVQDSIRSSAAVPCPPRPLAIRHYLPKKRQSHFERQALKAHATLVTTEGTERISNIEQGISNDEVRRNCRFLVWNIVRLSLVERLQLLEP